MASPPGLISPWSWSVPIVVYNKPPGPRLLKMTFCHNSVEVAEAELGGPSAVLAVGARSLDPPPQVKTWGCSGFSHDL